MGSFQTAITFNKNILTNGAQLPGQDYISGLVFYNDTPPSSWPSNGIKQCFSVQDVINAGLNNLHSDETKATGTYLVTNAGATGDVISIYVQEPANAATPLNNVLLVTYTRKSTDTTAAILAASITAAINANNVANGGYSASISTATITITARAGLGQFLNSGTPIQVVITGTIAGTITQFTAGVGSSFDVYYYHVSEFFRKNPNGILWVGIFDVPSTYDFTEITTLQTASGGTIRQVGVYTPARTVVTNGTADLNALNSELQTLDTNKMPLSGILASDIFSVSDLSTLPNRALLSDEWCSINISQDGAALGFVLSQALGKSVTNLGALLGCISAASVSECIGNPIERFNISNGSENEVPAFANCQLWNTIAVTLQTQLDNYRYIYCGNYTGYNGTYFNNSHCCIVQNSSYAYIEENRVQAKIERLMYAAYLPVLNSQISLKANGTLADTAVGYLASVGDNALLPMVQAGELSAVETVISPTQNITTSGKLVVTLYEINNPIARNIEVDVNPVTSLP